MSVVITPEIANDTRMVCVFCTKECSDENYGYCCGEAGAALTRAEFIEYMGFDYFSEQLPDNNNLGDIFMPKSELPVVKIKEVLVSENGFVKIWVSKDEGPVYIIPKFQDKKQDYCSEISSSIRLLISPMSLK